MERTGKRASSMGLASALAALLCALVLALASPPGAAWAEGETALTSSGGELSSGSYILNENVTLTTDITIPSGAEVTLDLAGHTLTGTGTGSVITVSGTLTLTDSGSGGTVTNGSATNGGGVYVDGGTLNMYGGEVSGNTASGNGAGVYVTGGTFTMEGGTITNNTATVSGGGVAASSSTVIMNGGTISSNTGSTDTSVEGNGGGISVYSSSKLTMNGGLITGNEVRCGGGVYVGSGSTFTMEGGAITNNKGVYDSGGGVYATGGNNSTATVTLNGGNISGNTAAWGAGVYLRKNVSFTMTGGAITNNTATPYSESTDAYGGGIHAYTSGCSVSISGGIISGNSATSAGGGIHMYRSTSFSMSGGTITGNSTDGKAGGVYIAKNATFEVTSEDVVITGNEAGTNADDLYLAKGASSISITGIAGSWYKDPEASRYGSDGYDSDSSLVTMTSISAGTVYPLHSEVSDTVTITYDGNDSDASPNSTSEDGAVASGTFTQEVTSSSKLADDSVFWLDRCHCISSWNTSADGSGTTYETGASAADIVSAGEDVTLYAQWSESHDYDYDDIEWTWTEDTDGSWSATATVACTWCGATMTIDATVTSETTAATCTEAGSTVYSATITDDEGNSCTDTQTVAIDALGHDYNYENITWSWTDDYSSATATVVCRNDSSHTLTAEAAVTSETTDATCTEAGSTVYTATITDDEGNSCTDTQTVTTDALGHDYDYDNATWTWADDHSSATATVACGNDSSHTLTVDATVTSETTAATCNAEGATVYTATAAFGEGDDAVTVTATATVAIDATGHTAADAVVENEVAATCTADGSYDSVVYCSVCGAELSRETVTVSATGHSWDEGTVTEPTCTEDGCTTYTCVVCGKTKTADKVEATGHSYDYDNATWAWADDHSSATATVTCENDSSHTLTIDATVTSAISDDGSVTYTATIIGDDGTEYADTASPSKFLFTDVTSSSSYYFEAVYALWEDGFIEGYTDGSYGVGDTLTRADLAVIIWRMGGEQTAAEEQSFDDVDPDAYYADAISWTLEESYMIGYSDTEFGPEDPVTFEQLCSVIARHACGGLDALDAAVSDDEAEEALSAFTDADEVSGWAADGVAWCVENDIVYGYDDATLRATELVARERAATVLWRSYEVGYLG